MEESSVPKLYAHESYKQTLWKYPCEFYPSLSQPQLRQSSFPSQADSGNSHPESLSAKPCTGPSGRNNQAWTHGSERLLQPTLDPPRTLLFNLYSTPTKEIKKKKTRKKAKQQQQTKTPQVWLGSGFSVPGLTGSTSFLG